MCVCVYIQEMTTFHWDSLANIKYFSLQSQHENIAVIHLLAAEKHHTDKWVYSENATWNNSI